MAINHRTSNLERWAWRTLRLCREIVGGPYISDIKREAVSQRQAEAAYREVWWRISHIAARSWHQLVTIAEPEICRILA